MAITFAVRISEFEFGNRFDAELYRPSLRESFDSLNRTKYELKRLHSACLIRSGTTPPDRVDGLQKGAILYKTTDIRNAVIPSRGDYYRISYEIHHRMSKTRISEGDVLLNIVGATLDVIGRTGFVASLENEANITQAMVFLRSNSPQLLSGYLFAFLNTRFAQDQIARYARPTGQYNLNLQEVGHILIPILPLAEQAKIEQMILKSSSLLEQAEDSYTQAQQLLESQLGLNKLRFDKPVGYTARFSELELSHRTDAQHYQPRFTQLLKHLTKYTTKRVREIRRYNRRGIQPVYVDGGTHAVINSQHLGPKHINYDNLQKTTEHIFNLSPEAHVQPNDLLIYTTGAYIGRTNVYLDEAPAFASNHVNILRLSPDIDHAYMAMVFQSTIGQFQTQKHSRGSTQAELYPVDIDKFVVPLLPPDKQQKIGNLVRESLTKQRESAQLLAQAKSRVEQLIEEAVQS